VGSNPIPRHFHQPDQESNVNNFWEKRTMTEKDKQQAELEKEEAIEKGEIEDDSIEADDDDDDDPLGLEDDDEDDDDDDDDEEDEDLVQ